MVRTPTVLLKPTDTKPLSGYTEQSAVLWNIANYGRRKASINADVNGAVNILNVAVNRFPSVLNTDKKETSGIRLMAEPLLLRWNNHEWS